jgi:hypothetical protein
MGMLVSPYRHAVAGGGSSIAYVSTSAQTSNSVVPTYPASISAGDFLLATVIGNTTTASTLDYSAPAGWTRITKVATPGTNSSVLSLFYRIADGSESGTVTFTGNGTGANANNAVISRFTGATKLEGLVARSTPNHDVTAISSPAVTTTGTGRLIVNVFGSVNPSGIAEEASWTEAYDHQHNGAGANDTGIALHHKASSGTGVQDTEEPTPAGSATAWGFVSFALCPSGSPAAPSIAVRGSRISYVNNASSIAFSFPASSAAGDLCVICTEHGFQANAPTGWMTYNASTGTNINGSVFAKILTAADISAGTVTITFGGGYYGVVGAVSFVGCAGGVRTVAATRNSTGATSRTVTTDATPQSGDYVIYFGSTRGNITCTVNQGSSLQTSSNANASGCVYGGSLGSSGAVSADFAYSSAGTGDFQAIIAVAPSP